MRYLFIWLIKAYRFLLSPILGVDKCRFTPSCSVYGVEALKMHGSFKGLGLTIWRVLRCQPLCRGGFDPVPLRKPKK
ncbi:MAG: membrane protein insertion efficiency factor YidD [Planctomycetota bacterium]|nr:membrane protein insertion efficiency factor YidD [Planctomycetota bacterium]MDA1114193.1 membrane protein insertion efficiency factor YidD [Planctomycetota bacterium]